ncbi:hypothetical protein PAPYR_6434 [Paratrimastix pyriformis]|uniref:Uncharacterized protein n=1 Tax=Paratrimastix pyriformis TaxID=342808 RepID=A0ABQ8UF53_9EUKA|nr:hypothetical protein PAPYR_6434 [Paratrimastix pyriformis]
MHLAVVLLLALIHGAFSIPISSRYVPASPAGLGPVVRTAETVARFAGAAQSNQQLLPPGALPGPVLAPGATAPSFDVCVVGCRDVLGQCLGDVDNTYFDCIESCTCDDVGCLNLCRGARRVAKDSCRIGFDQCGAQCDLDTGCRCEDLCTLELEKCLVAADIDARSCILGCSTDNCLLRCQDRKDAALTACDNGFTACYEACCLPTFGGCALDCQADQSYCLNQCQADYLDCVNVPVGAPPLANRGECKRLLRLCQSGCGSDLQNCALDCDRDDTGCDRDTATCISNCARRRRGDPALCNARCSDAKRACQMTCDAANQACLLSCPGASCSLDCEADMTQCTTDCENGFQACLSACACNLQCEVGCYQERRRCRSACQNLLTPPRTPPRPPADFSDCDTSCDVDVDSVCTEICNEAHQDCLNACQLDFNQCNSMCSFPACTMRCELNQRRCNLACDDALSQCCSACPGRCA